MKEKEKQLEEIEKGIDGGSLRRNHIKKKEMAGGAASHEHPDPQRRRGGRAEKRRQMGGDVLHAVSPAGANPKFLRVLRYQIIQ